MCSNAMNMNEQSVEMSNNSSGKGYWTFYCNPVMWPIEQFLMSEELEDQLSFNLDHHNQFEKGQFGVIRVGHDKRTKAMLGGRKKLERGIYAIVKILGTPIGNKVPIKVIHNLLESPITFEELQELPHVPLDKYLILGFQAASMPLTEEAFNDIRKLADERVSHSANRNKGWLQSETRRIFNATKESDKLLAYFESGLFKEKLADACKDSPNYSSDDGCMVYYLKGRRMYIAAPRKRGEYIHVVLTEELNKPEIRKLGIPLGNKNDVKLFTEDEIDRLLAYLQQGEVKIKPYHEWTLEEWVTELYGDHEELNRQRAIEAKRDEFIKEFIELEQLKKNEITFAEFKSRLDAKAKTPFDYMDEKINIWGFSGFSGQMFFNLLFNQAKFLNRVDEFRNIFLETIEIPEQQNDDFEWTKKKFERFSSFIQEMKKDSIEKGYSPSKCPTIKYMPFFVSFFWGIQNLRRNPIFYRASRDGLNYLGYTAYNDDYVADSIRYAKFVENLNDLSNDIQPFIKDEKDLLSADFLSHFLWYVEQKVKEEEDHLGDETDPILSDPFALKIRDVLYEHEYKMTEMATADNEDLNSFDENTHQLIWHYSGNEDEDISGMYFVWENEEDYHADVFLENSEGQTYAGKTIRSGDDQEFLIDLEKYLMETKINQKPYTIEDVARETYVDEELLKEWLELLSDKKQVVLYGPPGTGKTFVAERLARVLAQQKQLVELIQFHPSYTYEEFIEGLRPEVVEVNNVNQISIVIQKGIFSKLCEKAKKPENQNKSFVLIIDEINRANTAKVFGELLYALEYRNSSIQLPYSKEKLVVPENIYIIGTMNTTDRSLAQLDFALRRRFQFIPFSTKETEMVLERYLAENQPDMQKVAHLVRKVNEYIDDPDISVGHSYFIGQELTQDKLKRIWKYQIIPYLEECFVHDTERLTEFDFNTLWSTVNQYE